MHSPALLTHTAARALIPAPVVEAAGRSFTTSPTSEATTATVNPWRRLGIARLHVVVRGRKGFNLLRAALSEGKSAMSKKSGATNPTTERAAQPRLSLPPERQLATTIPLEEAVHSAVAVLDLFLAKITELDAAERADHEGSAWLPGVYHLAASCQRELLQQFDAHCSEVRRLQFAGLQPRDETRN